MRARQVALSGGNGIAFGRVDGDGVPIPRYTARFTLNDRLDDRACWVAWPEVVRMRIEQKQITDPLAELGREFRGGRTLAPYDRPEDVTYKLRDLDVCLSVFEPAGRLSRSTSLINFGFSEIFLDCLVEAAIEANHPVSSGGAFRDRHGRWVRDAMDAFARKTNAFEADGEVVWS